ncbi:M28 family metallopeptidase [Plantactinospora sp. KLBMP9567]|uniref:M28 family metallopeptidase n=1 Tax=Plantactinospora sp. KLBMP9567 TaxID=3085900 RepID=UPI002982684B|nr:M28 family peptidase [Plantactinospora sp. KLBMP9567]MDW5325011.1 M28 family peptidase [Plantactinospora sp. KLBMP9567]
MTSRSGPTVGYGIDAALAAVSADRAIATVTALAGDAFAGRRVGAAGNTAARAWLAARLADLGAAVTSDRFPVRAVPDIYATPTARWGDRTATTDLSFGSDASLHLASADLPSARRGPLALAGASDPRGHWLVVPAGTGLSEAYADADGSAGLLVARNVDADGWQFTMLAGPDPGPLPVITLSSPVHDTISRVAVAGGGWFEADAPIRRADVTAANLHGRLRSPAAREPDLLLTAHFDGVGDHPGLRQPAAADNASGVAVVLESARVLAAAMPAGPGLSVALLDGEEVGALGSARHAARLAGTGADPLVVNVDGAGRLHRAAAVEAGGPAHGLLAVLDQAGRHTGVPLAAGPVASDNRRYAGAGLAAIGIGAGMAGYHSPADTPDRVEPDTLAAITRLVVATVWLAASTPMNFHRRSAISDRVRVVKVGGGAAVACD